MHAGSLQLFFLASPKSWLAFKDLPKSLPILRSLKGANPKYMLLSASPPTCLVLLAWLDSREPKLWSQGGPNLRSGSAIYTSYGTSG